MNSRTRSTDKKGKALRRAVLLLTACLPIVAGCGTGKFFVPPCQQTNSCGGGGGGGSTVYSSFAYIANAIGTVALIPIPKTSFTSLTGSSINLGAQPSALAATPKGTFLYVATLGGSVVVYSIGANGTLTLGNNGSAVASTILPTWLAIDPSGNWLFMLSKSINALFEYQIDPTTGILTQVGQSTGIALSAGGPTQVYVTPNDQNVYVALGLGGLDTFSFNSASGALSNHLHYAPRSGSDLAIGGDNNSAFLFLGESGSGIRVFAIGAGGALSEIAGSPFASQLGIKSIVVDPTNSYVYAASQTASVISGYTLAANGALTELPTSPFTSGVGPVSMALDPTGTYLLAINNGGSPDLQVFSFDPTTGGQLDLVTSAATGTSPAQAVSLAVVP